MKESRQLLFKDGLDVPVEKVVIVDPAGGDECGGEPMGFADEGASLTISYCLYGGRGAGPDAGDRHVGAKRESGMSGRSGSFYC